MNGEIKINQGNACNTLLCISLIANVLLAGYIVMPKNAISVEENGQMERRKPGESTMDDGTMDDGTMDDGTMDDGTMDDGTVDDGTVDDGTVDDGTIRLRATTNSGLKIASFNTIVGATSYTVVTFCGLESDGFTIGVDMRTFKTDNEAVNVEIRLRQEANNTNGETKKETIRKFVVSKASRVTFVEQGLNFAVMW
jgi:hypothetical protein